MNYRRVSQNMLEFTQPSTYRIQNSKEKKREPLTMNKAKAHTHTQNSVTEKERKKHVPNGICTIVRTLAAFDIGFDYSDP